MTPPVNLFALSALLAADKETNSWNPRLLFALAQVCASERPMTINDLADAIRISQSQTSRIVAQLEETGVVARLNPGSRPIMLRPTDIGRRLDQRVRAHIDAALEAA